MCQVLLFHVSRHGQTVRIAERIAAALSRDGHGVTLLDLPDALAGALDRHDAVVVGCPVHFGRHDRSLERAVHANMARLAQAPNAFFSVSMSAAHGTHGLEVAQGYIERFIARTGWTPQSSATLAGGLAYTRYGILIRWVMRLIAKRTGASTDITKDHEYTDWQAVDRFAERFSRALRREPVAAAMLAPA